MVAAHRRIRMTVRGGPARPFPARGPDTTWAVHVPRRLQEARVQLARATEELRSRLGRTPTVKELSELMSLFEGEVREARLAANGYNSSSMDAARTSSAAKTRRWNWSRTSTPWHR